MHSASASSHSSGDKPHGRRLTKNPPVKTGTLPQSVSQGSSSVKSWSSGSIQRTPSAPIFPRSTHGKSHHRTPTSPNPQAFSSSNSSLEQTQNSSPLLQQEGFRHLSDTPTQYFNSFGIGSRPVSGRLSEESTSGGSSLESNKRNTIQRAPAPPLLLHANTEMTTTTSRPQLRQSTSFTMGEKGGPPSPPKAYTSSGTMSPKRNSDEVKPLPSAKTKLGFSKFMNSMLGSKRVEISHPTNPVHVTHVGFNFVTGEFTVCKPLVSHLALYLCWYIWIPDSQLPICTGITQRMAAIITGKRNNQKGARAESPGCYGYCRILQRCQGR